MQNERNLINVFEAVATNKIKLKPQINTNERASERTNVIFYMRREIKPCGIA